MKEIFRLKEMLEHENIPFEFVEHKEMEGYQIGYPYLPSTKDCICSVVQNKYSYGNKFNLLEIMGLLTDKERQYDSVCGCLSAEEVFNRIKTHYKVSVLNDKINRCD